MVTIHMIVLLLGQLQVLFRSSFTFFWESSLESVGLAVQHALYRRRTTSIFFSFMQHETWLNAICPINFHFDEVRSDLTVAKQGHAIFQRFAVAFYHHCFCPLQFLHGRVRQKNTLLFRILVFIFVLFLYVHAGMVHGLAMSRVMQTFDHGI